VVEQLGQVFEELKGHTTMLLVEQNLPLVSRVADVVYAVKEGRVVAEITDREAIRSGGVEAYL
jgi:ABC-type branched-subunit amino acid transport system ATPase component